MSGQPQYRGSRNNKYDESPLVDQFDDQVNTLQQTIGTLKQVSHALGDELEKHNALLDQMRESYLKSENLVKNLLQSVDQIFKATGLSPTTLTFLFAVGVVVFLWFYWKIYA